MFSYCGNNPVIFEDPSGLRKVARDPTMEPARPVVQKKSSVPSSTTTTPTKTKQSPKNNEIKGTVSVGLTVSGSLAFWSYSFRVSINTDLDGNSALQFSNGTGMSTGTVSAALLADVTFTNAPSVDNLMDMGYVVGVDMGCAAVNYNIIPDSENNTVYQGVSFSGGLSTCTSIGPSVAMSNTSKTIPINFNLLDFSQSVYNSMWGIY